MSTPKNAARLPRRIPLAMSAGANILPGREVTISAERCQLDVFRPDRLLIKHADRWFVHDILVEDRSQLGRHAPRGLPGLCFSDTAYPPPHWSNDVEASDVRAGEMISVTVSYVGDCEYGEPFESAVFGTEDPGGSISATASASSPPAERAVDRVTLTARSAHCSPNASSVLRLDLPNYPFYFDRLTLADAADWVVHDVRLRGRSLLLNSRDLPGVMFAGDQTGRPLRVGLVTPGDEICVWVRYVGCREEGKRLEYTVSGTKTTATGKTTEVAQSWSSFLAVSSCHQLLPNQRHKIRATPELPDGKAFLPRQIVVADADDWVVHAVTVGIHAQFANYGDLPGTAFSSAVVDGLLVLDPVRPGIDFAIECTFVGPSESGAPFVCGVYGDVVDLAESRSAALRRLVRSGPSPDAVAWRAQRARERGVLVDLQWED